ncbi:hypothetical protein A3C91_01880 [Candidatus Azambacteria bacterium RIFCSPHIGHO2_02_FULL_52_12]|uniref:Uncharacterized protein n=1 Tax=Candidatus Azambacteria bacterium RIFCSPLOWO2_01_FULL_46_25 TaxID=1797298 RepID=A0A1F5BVI0_9BACT|nr:MAG: hypothetical protein A3C91_01880 [Candidatus Azambacteria bacterium RIFCSPHIGHO2_02_FULL_52_12]OGD34588.1 MAG: hypothetical protein A2988_03740 [Candidatus Azambacteria bacterium RIFCSPLOWO2_01_FULL_46_25]OGD36892.1 MAG: hypothetical protein A2850_01710 [Candidatus Azambacteria bacterium RIFCSPHIGHO2_01_FULL_51_74]
MKEQYRVALCKDAGRKVVQIKESVGSWLCLHNNCIEDKNKDDEKLEILLDKVAVESFEAGIGIIGKL